MFKICSNSAQHICANNFLILYFIYKILVRLNYWMPVIAQSSAIQYNYATNFSECLCNQGHLKLHICQAKYPRNSNICPNTELQCCCVMCLKCDDLKRQIVDLEAILSKNCTYLLQVHLIKLKYCFYWQLFREMQINTFRMSDWFAVKLNSLVS